VSVNTSLSEELEALEQSPLDCTVAVTGCWLSIAYPERPSRALSRS
jgi:hypothetical protein